MRGGTSDDPVVYTAHPLFAERVRAALDPDDARQRRTELVTVLARHPSDRLSDRLRLVALALNSDAPPRAADVVDAARQALRLGYLALGERLARAALRRSGGLAARLALAHALGWQSRSQEADALLAEADSTGLTEAALMDWALLRAANQFWMLSEPERATAFLRTVRNRVADPGPRTTLDALSATFAMNAGNVGHAVKVAGEVLGGRRPGGGLGGQRGRVVRGAAGAVRRRRAVGAARVGRRTSRAAALHHRAGADHHDVAGGPARAGP